jgi:hypothetical protein
MDQPFNQDELREIERSRLVRGLFWCTGCPAFPQWTTFHRFVYYHDHWKEKHAQKRVEVVCPTYLSRWCHEGRPVARNNKQVVDCDKTKQFTFTDPKDLVLHLYHNHQVTYHCAVHMVRQTFDEWRVSPNPRYIDPGAHRGPELKRLENQLKEMKPRVLSTDHRRFPYNEGMTSHTSDLKRNW